MCVIGEVYRTSCNHPELLINLIGYLKGFPQNCTVLHGSLVQSLLSKPPYIPLTSAPLQCKTSALQLFHGKSHTISFSIRNSVISQASQPTKSASFISQTAHSLFAECVRCFFLEPLNTFSILWLVEKCMLLSLRPVYSILRRANPFYNGWSFLNVTLPDGYLESQGLSDSSSFSQWTFSYLLQTNIN